MNIFFLHDNPILAAEQHCDKHVVKMILETAQILCTVHDIYGTRGDDWYLPTHRKHPAVLWAAKCSANYNWTYMLLLSLCAEYTNRYGKTHKTERLIPLLSSPPSTTPFMSLRITDPVQCMPDHCKRDDPVTAYREYYKHYKAHFAKWKNGAPNWWRK